MYLFRLFTTLIVVSIVSSEIAGQLVSPRLKSIVVYYLALSQSRGFHEVPSSFVVVTSPPQLVGLYPDRTATRFDLAV